MSHRACVVTLTTSNRRAAPADALRNALHQNGDIELPETPVMAFSGKFLPHSSLTCSWG